MLNGNAAAIWYFNNLCKQILIIYNRLPSFFKLKHSSNYQIFLFSSGYKKFRFLVNELVIDCFKNIVRKRGGKKMMRQRK